VLGSCDVSCVWTVYVNGAAVTLDTKVTDGGRNWSVGQKQLLCLARAMLRNTKLVCIDEATSSVDSQTDSLMQATIRGGFADATVLTVAHRLTTLAASDLIVVLAAGAVVEVGTPDELLANPNSAFSALHQGYAAAAQEGAAAGE